MNNYIYKIEIAKWIRRKNNDKTKIYRGRRYLWT